MGLSFPLSLDQLQSIIHELGQPVPNWDRLEAVVPKGRWHSLTGGWFRDAEAPLRDLAERVKQTLSDLERKGIKFFDPASTEKQEAYCARYQIYLSAVHAVAERIRLAAPSQDSALGQAHWELKCREASLRYRLERANGGDDPETRPNSQRLGVLKEAASEWKKKQRHARETHEKSGTLELNAWEIRQLEELARYPEWIDRFLQRPKELAEVFDWALLNFNPVAPLVAYPEQVSRLRKALLKSNLGYVRRPDLLSGEGEVLSLERIKTKAEGVAKKVLTLPLYHGSFERFQPEKRERVSILKGEKLLHFEQGNRILTVRELLEELGKKNQREADFTLAAHWGVVNFHPVRGVWGADAQRHQLPGMTAEDWLKRIPPAKVVSDAFIQERYGPEIGTRPFFFKVMSARTHPGHIALDCHALWQLYLKMDNGDWKVVNAGIYAYRFAQSLLDGLWLFGSTMRRVFCFADQNGYYTHRARAALPRFPTEEQGKAFCTALYENWIQAAGVFQMAGYNCAHSVESTTNQCLSADIHYFKMPLKKASSGVRLIDYPLAFANWSGEWLGELVVNALYLLFLSWREERLSKGEEEEEVHSLSRYVADLGHIIYNPARLFEQIMERKPPFDRGELIWSHTEEHPKPKEGQG